MNVKLRYGVEELKPKRRHFGSKFLQHLTTSSYLYKKSLDRQFEKENSLGIINLEESSKDLSSAYAVVELGSRNYLSLPDYERVIFFKDDKILPYYAQEYDDFARYFVNLGPVKEGERLSLNISAVHRPSPQIPLDQNNIGCFFSHEFVSATHIPFNLSGEGNWTIFLSCEPFSCLVIQSRDNATVGFSQLFQFDNSTKIQFSAYIDGFLSSGSWAGFRLYQGSELLVKISIPTLLSSGNISWSGNVSGSFRIEFLLRGNNTCILRFDWYRVISAESPCLFPISYKKLV